MLPTNASKIERSGQMSMIAIVKNKKRSQKNKLNKRKEDCEVKTSIYNGGCKIAAGKMI